MYPGGNQRSYTPDVHLRYSGTNSHELSGSGFMKTVGSASIYQSTPKTKVSPSEILGSYAVSNMRVSSPPKPILSVGVTNNIKRSESPGRVTQGQTTSPGLSPMRSWSPTKFSEVETSTIQKQRKELQLLIGELKDRDRELNDMVSSHQKQIIAWETDRQRVLMLEKVNAKLKAEVKKRVEQVKHLREKVKTAESEGNSKSKELENTQIHLQQISEQANISTQQVQELQERNENLAGSVQELSSSLGQLQAREQELETMLKLKDSDIREANMRLSEVTQKLKKSQGLLQEAKRNENSMKLERDQFREQMLTSKSELDKLKADINKQVTNTGEHQAELSHIKQETLALQKELFLSGEREKRKDQLLDLAKSKQERTESELQHLRQVYDRQQRDLMYLQHQVQTQDGSDIFDRFSEITTDDESSVIMPFKKSVPNRSLAMFSDAESNLTDQEKPIDLKELQTVEDFDDISNQALKSSNGEKPLSPYIKLSNGPVDNQGARKSLEDEYENNGSPTSRLHKLLEESRKMVQNLEDTTPYSSTQTTPEQIKVDTKISPNKSPGKDSRASMSPSATRGSLTMQLNGYCSDSSN